MNEQGVAQEVQEQMLSFLGEYKSLCEKYGMSFQAALETSAQGIKPIIQVIKPTINP